MAATQLKVPKDQLANLANMISDKLKATVVPKPHKKTAPVKPMELDQPEVQTIHHIDAV